jgi:hypothetical protein
MRQPVWVVMLWRLNSRPCFRTITDIYPVPSLSGRAIRVKPNMSPVGGFGLITMTKPTAITSVSCSFYYDFYCIYVSCRRAASIDGILTNPGDSTGSMPCEEIDDVDVDLRLPLINFHSLGLDYTQVVHFIMLMAWIYCLVVGALNRNKFPVW